MSGKRGKYQKHSTKDSAFVAKFTSDMIPEIKGIKKPKDLDDDLDKELDEIKIPENGGSSIEDLTQKLLQAKLENLLARTKSINEKTTSIKRELWNQWTVSFMDKFEEAFRNIQSLSSESPSRQGKNFNA